MRKKLLKIVNFGKMSFSPVHVTATAK